MNNNTRKQVQSKLTKGLIDMIILNYLEREEMHGYQLICKIRKDFGVSLGPSSVYPLLGLIEKKGYVKSTWSMDSERPRKVYQITNQGISFLSASESQLKMVCKNIAQAESINQLKTSEGCLIFPKENHNITAVLNRSNKC
jgi:DNA-binding PadR family transcriptional regulator